MFFVVSKLFWLLAQPISLVLLLVLAALILVWFNRRRGALVVLGLALTLVGLLGYTSLGYLMIRPLEDRFRWPETSPAEVSAIIMLGGATNSHVSAARGTVSMNEAAERLTTTLQLARRYPDARIILSGGGGSLDQASESEAETAWRFFVAQGIAADRLVREGHSRNTIENAANTRQMLQDETGQVVLVTSAFHMPRSVGLFRREGIDVLAWPTDFRSTGNETFGLALTNPMDNFNTASVAMREWIGLTVYRLTGQIDDWWPAP